MTPHDLKEYIYDNKKIEFILEKIGCHHIQYHKNKNYYTCGNVDGDNPSCITVYNDKYLRVINYTRTNYFKDNSDIKPDIFTLVQYNLSRFNNNFGFREANEYLHKLFNLPLTYAKLHKQQNQGVDPLKIFKDAMQYSNKYSDEIEINEIDEIDYSPYIHIDLFREGIIKKTIDKFGLGYSNLRKRNIIPLRYWLNGKLLGYNQRTVIKNYKELGIRKYLITSSYPKSYNLYGLWENYDEIIKKGYVVVYEAEKSVLKRDSRNDSTGVALSGHSISNEQVRILIGLNVDIVICLDNDISRDEIRHMCEKFYGIRTVYYMYDSEKRLKPKDSIADYRDEIYKFYFEKYRFLYDEREHKKYLESLNNK